jgi:hypothetical protein
VELAHAHSSYVYLPLFQWLLLLLEAGCEARHGAFSIVSAFLVAVEGHLKLLLTSILPNC